MKPMEIGAFDAKTRLSELLEQVAGGQTFIITRRGRPIAELRPIVRADAPRLAFGCDRSLVRMGADFDAPLADFAAYE